MEVLTLVSWEFLNCWNLERVELSHEWSNTKGKNGVRIKTQETNNMEKNNKIYCWCLGIGLNEGNL